MHVVLYVQRLQTCPTIHYSNNTIFNEHDISLIDNIQINLGLVRLKKIHNPQVTRTLIVKVGALE